MPSLKNEVFKNSIEHSIFCENVQIYIRLVITNILEFHLHWRMYPTPRDYSKLNSSFYKLVFNGISHPNATCNIFRSEYVFMLLTMYRLVVIYY